MAPAKPARATTAYLDPWILIEESDAAASSPPVYLLFGWAAHHHRLLSLSWIRSSPVVRLCEAESQAETESGTCYALGRRVDSAEDLCDEGRMAWKALILGGADDLERRWLGALKAARWLGVPPPALNTDELAAFVARHGSEYLSLRSTLAAERLGSG